MSRKIRGARKSKRRSSPKQNSSSSGPLLTECAARYAIAISDPYSPEAQGSCVPTAPSRPSQKVTAWRDVIVTVGTGGYGCIMLAPTTCNDLQAIWYTGSTFSANTPQASIDAAQTGMNSALLNNLPYGYATQVDTTGYGKPSVLGRIVSAAISAEYIGTELNRGGNVTCFVDPDHRTVNNIAFDTTISRAEADISVPDASRTRCWVGTNGNDDLELDYPDWNYGDTTNPQIVRNVFPFSKLIPLAPTGSTDVGRGTPIMIIIFTGTAGNQFRCKVVEHVEYIGSTPDPMCSPNMTDAKGFELVQAAAGMIYKEKAARPRLPLRKIMKICLNLAWKKLTSPESLRAGAALLATL
jgi:hypothetical protein